MTHFLCSAKPFQFHECNNIDKVIADIENDKEILPETRWPYMSTRKKVLPTPPPDVDMKPKHPAKTNITTELRKHTVRKSLEINRVEEGKRLEAEKQRKEKSKVILFVIGILSTYLPRKCRANLQ